MLRPIEDTPFNQPRPCTASGNATQAWQNLGQDNSRLAIGLGCPPTKANIVHITQQSTAPGLIRTMSSVGRPYIYPVFGPDCPRKQDFAAY